MLTREQMKLLAGYIADRSIQEPNSGCWLWLLSDGSHGYPQGSMPAVTGERVSLAHRLSYLARHGKIPAGYDIDHLCRIRCCVNPDHLEAVTQAANRRRQFGYRAPADLRITACPKGHAGYHRRSYGKLYCPECMAGRLSAA